jgi:Ca2+-binding RTX toxin-like protein
MWSVLDRIAKSVVRNSRRNRSLQRQRALFLEPLEVRRVLAIDLSVAGGVAGEQFLVRRDGDGNIEVLVDNVLQVEHPAIDVNSVTINAGDGNDVLSVDFSGGNPIPASGINFFAGGSFTDSLVLTGGLVTAANYTFLSAYDGSASFDGGPISWTGLDAITDSLTVANRVFNYGALGDDVVVDAGQVGGDGLSRISSPGTGTVVHFTTPTATITINTDGGADVVHLGALDSASDATETEPNDTAATAQNVDNAGWNLAFNPDIGDDTQNVSTTMPHVTIHGAGNGPADFDVYSFTIPNTGAPVTAIFDIDHTSLAGDPAGYDSDIQILGPDGTTVIDDFGGAGDDSVVSWGAGGSNEVDFATDGSYDSYLSHVFNSPGTYFLVVASFGGLPIPNGAVYTLHILIPNHPLTSSNAQFLVNTGAGPDRIYGSGGADILNGGDGDDYISGGPGDDVIIGGNGHDRLYGNDGDDVIIGNGGNDIVSGGSGNDQLSAQTGQDLLVGGTGRDHLLGNSDRDILVASGITRKTGGTGINGDSTLYDDANDQALQQVLLEWLTFINPDVNFMTTGDDGEQDRLLGGPGEDYFLADGTQDIIDSQ